MIKKMIVWAACVLLAGCNESAGLKVIVQNPTSEVREHEMMEIATEIVFERLHLNDTDQFLIYDEEGNEIPYQLTYDEKVVFPVDIDSMENKSFIFQEGKPQMVNTQVFGAQYPEWQDDLVWENDKMAYRAYGPDVQQRGQKAFGYDIFTKNVSELVMESRYAMILNEETWNTIKKLRDEGERELADSIENSISYHVDHGTGMDCYQVGATLGAGTTALLDDNTILYPYCYSDFEILDNGPLRYTMRLKFHPLSLKNDSNIVETRLIQLDKGSYLNKTTVSYENLTDRQTLVTGLVIHEPFVDRYQFDIQNGYMAYADPTQDVKNGNGIIYVGAVFPNNVCDMKVQLFEKPVNNALGHILAFNDYIPGSDFVYYWGAGWSKAGFSSDTEWVNYLQDVAAKVRNPLIVEIE